MECNVKVIPMKIGYIDYLNCFPFYYHMFEIEPLHDIQIVPAYPSELNRMMTEGMLDMSPISAAAYADLEQDVMLFSDFCLSSIGYVHSVILKSLAPIEDLHAKKVGLSSASLTSIVLLKILMKSYYAIEPIYLPTTPSPSLKDREIDAALVIGNDALIQEVSPYTYDLGDLWLRKTGHPVVFAVFAVREAVMERYSSEIKAVIDSYQKSLACLDGERDSLVQKARARYPSIKYDIDAYYRSLEYTFHPKLKEALAFFLFQAGGLGLLKKVKVLKFMDDSLEKVKAMEINGAEIPLWVKKR